jgi:DNA repair photolyase
MTHVYTEQQTGCPVGCRYCVVTRVTSRRDMWNNKTIIGMNKAVTILNPPPDIKDRKALDEFYNFPKELLEADIIGFNAISDPFWPKYGEELRYFLRKIAPVAKLAVCVTKFPIPDDTFCILAEIPNFRLNVSITGLDTIERTKTSHRLRNLRKAKEFDIKAFPIIHHYIAGMSDLSFLKKLKSMGYDRIDVKGLRYEHQTMQGWMPRRSQQYYKKKSR